MVQQLSLGISDHAAGPELVPLMERLNALCTEAGARDPGELANALALLIEGIYASSQTYGPGCGPITVAPRVAAQLVALACGEASVE